MILIRTYWALCNMTRVGSLWGVGATGMPQSFEAYVEREHGLNFMKFHRTFKLIVAG